MKILELEDFFNLTSGGRPNNMNTEPYINYTFECACGNIHKFNKNVNVIRELPKQRLVFECPNNSNYVTCVKLKGWLRFKGFESLYGALAKNTTNNDNKEHEEPTLFEEVKKILNKISTIEEFISISNSTVEILAINFQRKFNYNDINKLYIVFTYIYFKFTFKDTLSDENKKKCLNIVFFILTNHENITKDKQLLSEDFKNSLDFFSYENDKIDYTMKDESQKLSILSSILNQFLFPDKEKHELLAYLLDMVEDISIMRLLASKQNNFLTISILDEVHTRTILHFRELGKMNNCSPTDNISDNTMIEIMETVGEAFKKASHQRNENIQTEYLFTIFMKFFGVYEKFGKKYCDEHLQYEINKYLNEGLRDDYKQDLKLF